MNKRELWKTAAPTLLLPLVLALAMMALGCEMDGTNGNSSSNKTALEGTWESDSGEITFSGNSFTLIDTWGGTSFKGTFTLSGGQITMTVTQFSEDGGATWSSFSEYEGDDFPPTATMPYNVDGKELTITGVYGGTFSKDSSQTVNPGATPLEGTWVGNSGRIIVEDYSYRLIDSSGTGNRGTFTLSENQIVFTRTQFTEDGGATWLSRDAYLDELIKLSLSYSDEAWNSLSADEKNLLRSTYGSLVASSTETRAYTITDNELSLTTSGFGGTTQTYQKFPPSGATALTVNQWKDGEFAIGDVDIWYSFSATASTEYYIWWNDSAQGNYEKTANVRVSAWYSNGNAIFTDIDHGWTTPRSFTPESSSTVYVRVYRTSSTSAGTFNLVYSAASTRPGGSTGTVFLPLISDTTPLTENQWKDDSITSAGGEEWYSFNVTANTTYYVWWNRYTNGDGSKTMNIAVSAWYSNEDVISNLNNTNAAAWTSARSFTATANTTVFIKVNAYSSTNNTGTYGLVYGTSSTPRPPQTPPSATTALTENQWANGSIDVAGGETWYSFDVTSGTTYNIWWNDYTSGDGSSTANVRVNVSDANEDFGINEYHSYPNDWNTPLAITPTSSGKVYVKVYTLASATTRATGTYGIVYSTNTVRPAGLPTDATPLTLNQWVDDSITASAGEQWYSFEVSSGTPYRMWWENRSLNIRVSAWYANDVVIFNGVASSPTAGQSFTPSSTTTVYVKVYPDTQTTTDTSGSYRLICSDSGSTSKPAYLPSNPIPLTVNLWADGEITDATQEDWYSFEVTNNTTYRIWLNNSSDGDGSKTGNVYVNAIYSNGNSALSSRNTAWTTTTQFTANSTGTIYVKVERGNGSVGTYSVVYKSGSDSTRPQVLPSDAAPLTAGQWTNGAITSLNGEEWYTFNVTMGTQYNIWLNNVYNGDSTKTGNVTLRVYTNGTQLSTLQSAIYNTPWSFTPNTGTSNGIVHVRVELATQYDVSFGTYGLVYSDSSTRP